MALVICWVLRTERMRRRISIRLGMRGGRGLLGDEAVFEFLDYRADLGAERIVERFLFENLGQQRAVRVVHKTIHLLFELAHLLHWQIVEKALRAGKDNQNLLLYGQRLELALL